MCVGAHENSLAPLVSDLTRHAHALFSDLAPAVSLNEFETCLPS